jgi:hypothetical protein
VTVRAASSAEQGGSALVAQAWERFCDTLRTAGGEVLAQRTPSAEPTRPDGFTHLAQLLTLGLDFFVLNADPDFPEFTRVVTPTRKWALDNPDSLYDRAPVSGDNTYRITGTMGSAELMLFDINTGMLGSSRRPRRQAAHLTSRDMEIADDGTFEITVGGDDPGGNWLPLDPTLSPLDFGLVVRQYFGHDDARVPASFSIDRVGTPAVRGPRSASAVASGLTEAADFALDMLRYWATVANDFEPTPNEMLPQIGSRVDGTGANPDNVYYWGLWRLEPGRALVVRSEPAPDAELWNFYGSNIWWEDVDDRSHRMKVNAATARSEPDGALEIVLCDRDPGFGNHVQVSGPSEGIMLLRLTFPRSIPTITTRVGVVP